VDWSLNEFVISLLSKPEIVQVRLDTVPRPIMVANGWEKSSGWRSFSIFSLILINIFVVILSDVIIHFIGSAGLIIIPTGDDEIRIPTLDQICHIRRRLTRESIVTDDGEDNTVGLGVDVYRTDAKKYEQ
jgi:hypothetical protein